MSRNLVDVSLFVPQFLRCERQPSFNVRGSKGAKFCSHHKEDGMVNVVNKTCQLVGCMKVNKSRVCDLPKLNFRCAPISTSCMMISLVSSLKFLRIIPIQCLVVVNYCLHQRPTFNMPNQRPGIFCHQVNDLHSRLCVLITFECHVLHFSIKKKEW
jgi:hypothetical protein